MSVVIAVVLQGQTRWSVAATCWEWVGVTLCSGGVLSGKNSPSNGAELFLLLSRAQKFLSLCWDVLGGKGVCPFRPWLLEDYACWQQELLLLKRTASHWCSPASMLWHKQLRRWQQEPDSRRHCRAVWECTHMHCTGGVWSKSDFSSSRRIWNRGTGNCCDLSPAQAPLCPEVQASFSWLLLPLLLVALQMTPVSCASLS